MLHQLAKVRNEGIRRLHSICLLSVIWSLPPRKMPHASRQFETMYIVPCDVLSGWRAGGVGAGRTAAEEGGRRSACLFARNTARIGKWVQKVESGDRTSDNAAARIVKLPNL